MATFGTNVKKKRHLGLLTAFQCLKKHLDFSLLIWKSPKPCSVDVFCVLCDQPIFARMFVTLFPNAAPQGRQEKQDSLHDKKEKDHEGKMKEREERSLTQTCQAVYCPQPLSLSFL